MAHMTPLLFFVAALICVHSCSADQNAHQNNNDPCQDPTSPQYYQVIPWRESEYTDRQLLLPRFPPNPVELTDTTGCVKVQILDFTIYQPENPLITPSFSAGMRGNVLNLCGGPSYTFDVTHTGGHYLAIPSLQVQSATLEPLTLTGTYRNDTYSEGLTITTDRANFYATTQPYSKTQRDDFSTDNNSPCKTRLRYDDATNLVYSSPFHLTATSASGHIYSFTFPVNVPASASYYRFKFFYEQCTCADSATAAGASQTRAYAPNAGIGFAHPRP